MEDGQEQNLKSFRIDTKSIYKGSIEYPLISGKVILTSTIISI